MLSENILKPIFSSLLLVAPSNLSNASESDSFYWMIMALNQISEIAENSVAIEILFAFRTRVGPGKHLLHIADRFEANTVLCSFNTQTIQLSSIKDVNDY